VPQTVTLRDGALLDVRPITPDDRGLLEAGFERLSPEARYRRFFSPVSRLSARQLDYLTRIDHHDHEALLGIDHATGTLVGVARYVRTGPETAEPAMVVADDWQGRGVATVLLSRLVARALEEGIDRFSAPVLAGNDTAINVLRALGDTSITRRGNEVELFIELAAPARPVSALRGLMRAVAAGTVDPALTLWYRLLPRVGPAPDEPPENVIVAAVEDTDEGTEAGRLAGTLAAAADASVVLVGTRHPVLDDGATLQTRLRRIAGQLRGDGVPVREEVRTGDLAAVTLDVAVTERARLIVVADTTDPEPAGRLLGETWDHISHHAPCSVLVARRPV
jgi:GNAT superfamily N-acetyltransferase